MIVQEICSSALLPMHPAQPPLFKSMNRPFLKQSGFSSRLPGVSQRITGNRQPMSEIDVVETYARWVEVDGHRIRYFTAGESGPPVVLIHGAGIDSALLSYRSTIIPLSERHRVFAPDLPGYGESDKPEIDYTTEYYTCFIANFMDALRLEKASLVGHSMGGAIALGLALLLPDKTNKLVLVSSYGLGHEIPRRLFALIFMQIPFLNEVLWKSVAYSRWLAKRSMGSAIYDPRTINAELIAAAQREVGRPRSGSAFRSYQRSEVTKRGLRTGFAEDLSQLTCPTLILHGAQDKLIPLFWAQRAHELISHSKLCVLDDCGHIPQREKPEEFNSAVLNFLNS